MIADMPRAAAPLIGFAPVLRAAAFPVSSEQTRAFLEAVRLVGPTSMRAIQHAAHAAFAPRFERREAFDALIRAHFCGDAGVLAAPDDEENIASEEERDPASAPELAPGESGSATTAREILFIREFAARDARLHSLGASLPRRRALRMRRHPRGERLDLGRSLARIVRHDGDIPMPTRRTRRLRPRRILLLIDISGSMKQHSDDHLRLAHSLVHSVAPVEAFTLGTRLTRITAALAHRRSDVALARVADAVADWDGGTQLGATLARFIAEPRYAGHARGSAVIMLSDMLERGDPALLVGAVRRLALRAWRMSVATPLAADPRFRPETAALKAMLPFLDDLVDGGSLPALIAFLNRLDCPSTRKVSA
ncbi:MAG: VWA domain-containing protein [Sphingobium sp.]|uniref:VWA domain-containing protein n=1 Tax=Sphingobium sp. TaxID=1912891 RepID=UPI002E24C0E7